MDKMDYDILHDIVDFLSTLGFVVLGMICFYAVFLKSQLVAYQPPKEQQADELVGSCCLSMDKDGCNPNLRVPMVFSWCSLGILGDYNP